MMARVRLTKNCSPKSEAGHGISEQRERPKGTPRYRGFYKGPDAGKVRGHHGHRGTGSWRSPRAEKRAGRVGGGPAGGPRPGPAARPAPSRSTRRVFLRHTESGEHACAPPRRGNRRGHHDDTLRLHVIPFIGRARIAETEPAGGAQAFSRRWRRPGAHRTTIRPANGGPGGHVHHGRRRRLTGRHPFHE